jgi:phosphoribosylaminoimidazolecarboxamide formyltransferase/IMP cyclohydrolase
MSEMDQFFRVDARLWRECKYGENALQAPAGFYALEGAGATPDPLSLSNFKVIEGTEPSYNNLCDLDRLVQTITHAAAVFPSDYTLAMGVKHGNPCGAAYYTRQEDQCSETMTAINMMAGDTRAIFGGSVIMNFSCTKEVAGRLMVNGRAALDTIIAPEIAPEVIESLSRKGGKCRFIVNPALGCLSAGSLDHRLRFRYVRGGVLVQPNYLFILDFGHTELKVYGERDHLTEDDLRLAWAVGSTSNSNTITLVKDGALIGNGVGQQDRVGAAELAIKRARDAGHQTAGAVAYSDSFFPFPDGVAALIAAGIKAIFSTSGSVNDGKVQALCQAAGVTLYQLPDKIARGFFGH